MKSRHDPKRIVKKDYPGYEDYLKTKRDKEFYIGQSYEEKPAKTLYCRSCGSNEFKVGIADYFTAVKCKKCQYEICIHDG
jgi:ribosomal protein L40E